MVLHILRSKKFARRVLIGLLIVIIPAFVLWGAGSLTKGPQLIGTIAGEKIYPDAFVESIQGMRVELLLMYFGDYDTYTRLLRDRTLMNQLAWERLIFLAAADSDRVKVTDEELLSYIGSHPLFQRGGAFNQEAYNHIVKTVLRMEPRQFEEYVRDKLKINRLQMGIYGGLSVPDEDLRRSFRMMNDTLDITCVLVPSGGLQVTDAPGEEEISAYYEGNKGVFVTPPMIEMEYLTMSYGDAAARQEVMEKLGAVYPELKEDPAGMAQKADALGAKYTQTGPLGPNDLIPGVEYSRKLYSIASTLETGALSAPLFSGEEQGEVYILRKTKETPSRPMSLEEVHDNISAFLTEQRKAVMAHAGAQAVSDRIISENITLEEGALPSGYEAFSAAGVSYDTYIDNIGPANQIFDTALDLEQGVVSGPVDIAKGAVLIRVDAVSSPGEDVFREQRSAIQNRLLADKRRELLVKWFSEGAPQAELKRPLDEI